MDLVLTFSQVLQLLINLTVMGDMNAAISNAYTRLIGRRIAHFSVNCSRLDFNVALNDLDIQKKVFKNYICVFTAWHFDIQAQSSKKKKKKKKKKYYILTVMQVTSQL